MTSATLHILLSLAAGPQHGYGIKRDVEARTDGEIRLGSGTLYEAVQRLQRDGWIREVSARREAETASGGPPRRFYALTAAGRRALAAEIGRLSEVVRYAARHDLLPESR